MIKDPKNWLEEFERSKTHEIMDIIWDLSIYHGIIESNFRELQGTIVDNENFWSKYPLKPPSMKWKEEHHLKIELIRCLHNYLMSIYSLREKADGWKEHLNKGDKDFISEEKYKKTLQKLKVEKRYNQLRRIRNNFAHKRDIEGFRQIDLRYYKSPNGVTARLTFREIDLEIKNFLNQL